jgi:hypothetical protein
MSDFWYYAIFAIVNNEWIYSTLHINLPNLATHKRIPTPLLRPKYNTFLNIQALPHPGIQAHHKNRKEAPCQ